MAENNKELVASLLDKIKTLEAKKRKTLSDYGMLSIYQLIHNASDLEHNYRAGKPTQEQIDKATPKQKAEYDKLTELKTILEKFYSQTSLADYQLTLFYERVENCIHTLIVCEHLEQQLSETLGQEQAMSFMLKAKEGLLTTEDVQTYQKVFFDASYNFGISAQSYIYTFQTWIDIVAEQFNIPELQLLKDSAHSKMTTAITTAKKRLSEAIIGTETETTTKLNNLENIFKNIAQFNICDYSLNKRQLTDLKQDVRAFKKGMDNTLNFSLYELYFELQEKLENEYIKLRNKA